MNKRILVTGFLVLVGLSGCSTIRQSSNFSKRAPEVRTIAIMPSSVSIQRIVFKGMDEVLYKESEAAAKQMAETLKAEMASRGYEAKILNLEDKLLTEDASLKEDVSKLKDRYAALVNDAQKQYVNKMKWKDFKLSLGSDVNSVVDALNADVLIFSSAAGFIKSKGEISSDVTKTLLIGVASLGSVMYVAPSSGGQIFISVIDGDNGEMLWHNFSNPALKTNLTQERNIKNLVKSVINRYPRCAKKSEPNMDIQPAVKDAAELGLHSAAAGAPKLS